MSYLKIFLILLPIYCYPIAVNAQISIAEAREMPYGSTVTIAGVATNGDELGEIRFIQDSTGAIAAYAGSGSQPGFAALVSTGNRVQVTGVKKNFHNLMELDPIIAFAVLEQDVPLPEAIATNPEGLDEGHESQLIRVEQIEINGAGSHFTAGIHAISDGTHDGWLYLNSGHPLIGSPIPNNTLHITGICSQYDSDYQLLPRGESDIAIADDFYFTQAPVQSNINPEGFTLNWQTNIPATTGVYYGITPNTPEVSVSGGISTDHTLTLTGLLPATVYYVRAFSIASGMAIESDNLIMATASNSSGEMRIYFNHEVDANYSNGSTPAGISGAQALNALLNKIDDAEHTIDMCAYNINESSIVDALNEAVMRGVRVRFVTDIDSGNDALDGSEDFPVLEGNSEGIMHNKILIIDADDPVLCWVITGSMNFTSQNIFDDYNNLLMIQDQSLARAYTMEFEELWGGDGDNYNLSTAVFGADKSDNTPHKFQIGGRQVEAFFSPTDPVTSTIASAMQSADASIFFGLLTFTSDEIAESIVSRFAVGVDVRGIIDNTGDVGSEYNYLVANEIPMVSFEPVSGWQQFHHKYGIIDSESPDSDPLVITGSHNWTAAAQNINDENTLLIYDADISNLYRQEFFQRWCELTDCTAGSIDIQNHALPYLIYPQPSVDLCHIQWLTVPADAPKCLGLKDATGAFVRDFIYTPYDQGITFPTGRLPTGLYHLLLQNGGRVTGIPVLVIH